MNSTNAVPARRPWTMDADAVDADPARSRSGSFASSSAAGPAGRDGGRRGLRLAGITALWWLHGLVRLFLALGLLFYGGSKLVLMQFGVADLGDALIAQGEMSPMGLLWRMVAFSPLFQFLAGLAEVGAGLALLWRRTVILGAILGLADMVFVLVLNLGYDVPVKQGALALAVMSLVVLTPWLGRIARATLGQGAVPAAPMPRLLPWRRADRITSILVPVAVGLLSVAIAIGTWSMLGRLQEDTSVPTGVWTVSQDSAPPAAQLSEDERWSAIAFGQTDNGGRSRVQIRRADGELLRGTYTRTDETHVRLEIRPLLTPGTSGAEYRDSPTQRIDLTIAPQDGGTLHVSGEGIDLVLSPDADGRILFDRGFRWSPREDDPFNR